MPKDWGEVIPGCLVGIAAGVFLMIVWLGRRRYEHALDA